MASSKPEALQGHIPALDGIRGIAILMVMLLHQTIMDSQTAFDRWLWYDLVGYGWSGVDLFFVLSGFLITGILFDSKGAQYYLRNFYARRMLRIWPVYLAVVCFSLLILPYFSHPKIDPWRVVEADAAWYWVHLSNYAIVNAGAVRHPILDISWSLSIEEQFYLVWPFVVLWLGRKGMMRACVAIIVVSLGLRIGLVANDANPITTYMLTPCRVDQLACGSWIALVARGPGGLAWMGKHAKRVAGLSGLLVVGLMLLSPGKESWRDPFVQTIGLTVHGVFFGSLLVLAITLPKGHTWPRVLSSRFLRSMGKYSYALYLFHNPVTYAIRFVVRDTVIDPRNFPTVAGSQFVGQWLFYALATSATFAAAWLSWNLLEKRMLSLKRFFPSPAGAKPMLPAVQS
jgi:peptidoglycan/LPS O-acetylase OafA/YrhL